MGQSDSIVVNGLRCVHTTQPKLGLGRALFSPRRRFRGRLNAVQPGVGKEADEGSEAGYSQELRSGTVKHLVPR